MKIQILMSTTKQTRPTTSWPFYQSVWIYGIKILIIDRIFQLFSVKFTVPLLATEWMESQPRNMFWMTLTWFYPIRSKTSPHQFHKCNLTDVFWPHQPPHQHLWRFTNAKESAEIKENVCTNRSRPIARHRNGNLKQSASRVCEQVIL